MHGVGGLAPVQLAYFVGDVRAAAQRAAALSGAGPFHVLGRIELAECVHRGRSSRFVHTSAYGQWGGMMLEFVQQDSDGPSPFRDMFARGEEGLHHVASFVDSMDGAIARLGRMGCPLASRARTLGGLEFAFVDTRAALGHMLELYEAAPVLRDFYAFVRDSASGWDGSDPVRELGGA